jgi:hypothetical protein
VAVYSVIYSGTLTASGTDSDLIEITPADDKPCYLRGMVIGQTSELGDTAEENIRISIVRLPATFTSGSGGSSVTPQILNELSAAAGFTAECNNTTVATTSGTAVTLEEFAWNERATPMERWWPEDKYAITVRGTSGLVVRSQTTVADDISIAMTFYVEEY